ncbi:MAG: carboxymuconolactone decarboxylase family protein [Miltoncostaeaceae bacterium]
MDDRHVDVKRELPEAYRALAALTRSAGSLGDGLDELVKLRASQLNGCSYCIATHTDRALVDGQDSLRLSELERWRDSDVFSARERAALTLTEALTRTDGLRGGVEPELAGAAEELDQDTLARLVVHVIAINAWNRSAIVGGLTAG